MEKLSTPLLEKGPSPPQSTSTSTDQPTPKLSKTSIRLIAFLALSLYTYRALSYPSLSEIGDAAHRVVDGGYGLVTGYGLGGMGGIGGIGREEVRRGREGECPAQPEAIGKGEWVSTLFSSIPFPSLPFLGYKFLGGYGYGYGPAGIAD